MSSVLLVSACSPPTNIQCTLGVMCCCCVKMRDDQRNTMMTTPGVESIKYVSDFNATSLSCELVSLTRSVTALNQCCDQVPRLLLSPLPDPLEIGFEAG